MRPLLAAFALLNALLFNVASAQPSQDATPLETSKKFGDYEIFFNAIPSMTLLPEMAAKYRIERDKNIAYINITVFKKSGNGTIMQAATLKGTSSDLMTNKPLAFREMREADSIGYVAQVRYNNREVLRFDVQVQPELKAGEVAPIGSPFNISFTRKFYTEQ
ncbi:MAG: DUF4426 domain-containing protein [Spongiibacteraceae bacterium]